MSKHLSAALAARLLLVVSTVSSVSLLPMLSALADQNSPKPGDSIENQATASFTDAADNTTSNVLSDKVSVKVAEVAGISAVGSAISSPAGSGAYRTGTVYFDFKVTNEGNDQSKLFIPATVSKATIAGANLPAGSVGQLQVVEYKANPTATAVPITTGNLVDTSAGSSTGSLTGVAANNGGSIAPGGYVIVRVPVTIPFSAVTGNNISVTLGNLDSSTTPPQASNSTLVAGSSGSATSTPWVVTGAATTGNNDLYTVDNTGTDNSDADAAAPANGVREANATQSTPVVDPPTVNITGTVWDDANGTGTATFTGIQDGTEPGADTSSSTPALNAILVTSTGKVLDSKPVNTTNGTYTLSTLGVQNGVYVFLSTTSRTAGDQLVAADLIGSLPTGWTNTTPLSYTGTNAFNIGITATANKDFGIDRLPTATDVSTTGVATPTGTNTTQVPTLTGSDPEDTTITKFKILSIPNPTTEGKLYYDGTEITAANITAGYFINSYDPAKLRFDPVDTATTISFTYAAVDNASKLSASATASISYTATAVTISGTVWHDKNNSANNTFTGINNSGEVGTNAVFGTTQVPVKAFLVNAGGTTVIASQEVLADGTYSFSNIPANTDVKVIISKDTATGTTPPTAGVPNGWVKTSPVATDTFNTGLSASVKDFGIRQKGKLVLIKRITKVNSTSFSGVVDNPATAFDDSTMNWPSGYLKGAVDAGLVKPGDKIEYTVYFLNNQGANASNVKVCDPIRGSQTYVDKSMKLQLGGTGDSASDVDLTDLIDSGSGSGAVDRAHSYSAGNAPSGCNADDPAITGTDNGGIAIELTGGATTAQPANTVIPGATAPGTADTYGLFRFTTTVKP
jgi:hypothetical protein